MSRSGWRFWIDRGGTFTDVVARSPDGELTVVKVLSEQPDRPGDPAVRVIRKCLGLPASEPIPAGLVAEVRLGTTVAIQGDALRVTGKSKDDLQAVIQLLKEQDVEVPLQFQNYR